MAFLMRRPPEPRGVASALMWFIFYVAAFGGGAVFVVLRAWQHTHSSVQTVLAAVMYAAVLKIICTRQRLARRRKMSESLPRYYDSRGTTAL